MSSQDVNVLRDMVGQLNELIDYDASLSDVGIETPSDLEMNDSAVHNASTLWCQRGPASSALMCVLQSKPDLFASPAGALLDKMLVAMEYDPQQVHILYLESGRVGEPLPDTLCESLISRVQARRPQCVIAFGHDVWQALNQKRSEQRSMQESYLDDQSDYPLWGGRWVSVHETSLIGTLHPDELIRNPDKKRIVWQDLKKVMHRLKTGRT